MKVVEGVAKEAKKDPRRPAGPTPRTDMGPGSFPKSSTNRCVRASSTTGEKEKRKAPGLVTGGRLGDGKNGYFVQPTRIDQYESPA